VSYGPDIPYMSRAGYFSWDRIVTLAGLAILCVLAWLYIVAGAGMGASPLDITSLTLFPHQHTTDMAVHMRAMDNMSMSGMAMKPATWTFTAWILVVAMWWIMMIAMMSPSVVPTVLLYARVYRQASGQSGPRDRLAPTAVFAVGYFSIWLVFSVSAAALHWMFESTGIISAENFGSQSQWLSSGVLIAAGAYQFSPIKNVCLSHCRAPVAFLSRHWRPYVLGTLRLGVMHGAYCVGCCWVLMLLLFVGGVMNVAWIAALSVLFLIEKTLPAGLLASRATGVILIACGIATILV